jgi:hypothetical protein
MAAKTPRWGFRFLGSGQQSVGERTCRALSTAVLLARPSSGPVDELRLMQLVLFHEMRLSIVGRVHSCASPAAKW